MSDRATMIFRITPRVAGCCGRPKIDTLLKDLPYRNTIAPPAPDLKPLACLRLARTMQSQSAIGTAFPKDDIRHLAKATSVRAPQHRRLRHHLQQHLLLFKSP